MLLLADNLRLAAEGLLSMVAGSSQVAANWYTVMVAYQMWSKNADCLTELLLMVAGSSRLAGTWRTLTVAYRMWSMNVAFLTRILSVVAGC